MSVVCQLAIFSILVKACRIFTFYNKQCFSVCSNSSVETIASESSAIVCTVNNCDDILLTRTEKAPGCDGYYTRYVHLTH